MREHIDQKKKGRVAKPALVILIVTEDSACSSEAGVLGE